MRTVTRIINSYYGDRMNTKLLAIGAVIIIVAAGASAYFLMNKKDDKFPNEYPGTYMTVLGNANEDLAIDDADVTAIEKVIADGNIDYKKNYMCDANHDKSIDANDVEFVKKIIAAQVSDDWSAVGSVYYVNVDYDIVSYDMTKTNKVITLIAPPLDTVLAMGGKDLVVGFDNRITTGKYHAEYADTFNFSSMVDVGDCKDPDTEVITKAASDNGGSMNVVCGTKDTYGPKMETKFKDTGIQVIRIASWEYGGTLYGLMTLGFLLKKTDEAKQYYDFYQGIANVVKEIVNEAPDAKKAAGGTNGVAVAYGYVDELSLLGRYTGEYANLMALDPYDSGGEFLNGKNSGGHGDTIDNESVLAMYQQNHLRKLILMVGMPFQVTGDAQSSAKYIKSVYDSWNSKLDSSTMPELEICVCGYSMSSGVSEVLNRLVLSYYLYNDTFLAHFGCADQASAQAKIEEYANQYCQKIGIDGVWSFEGAPGTTGMNLLYCGEGSSSIYNIMNGPTDAITV